MKPVDAGSLPLDHEPVDDAQRIAGAPSTGWRALGTTASGGEYGVWEMSSGTMSDVEADEVFVVLAGRATVVFSDGRVAELTPGTVMRLSAGERTTWTVHETLRKVYVTPA
ncbi:cupin domain-containing protein [Protaetiibacter mangrovi]|uniref:Cupin domain-containing protein n=1 Tax=Protaetiibacter mangrovi TaxID=2970926 RepID=A0ABT1ZG19_9MICO|nr:cupin domain-containing protein [Protaetiibacter mangrovi]MCS0499653.1 cupin domain-containing protein [Protaetiibacter mangrovi]TPX02974.1 cupin domain-containing protein [Schumannella luteola]